jgi:hypothetical protein
VKAAAVSTVGKNCTTGKAGRKIVNEQRFNSAPTHKWIFINYLKILQL